MLSRESDGPPPVVVAVTGASGSAYALRLLEVLLLSGRTIELIVSGAARQVFRQEVGLDLVGALTTETLEEAVASSLHGPENVWGFRDLRSETNSSARGSVRFWGLSDYNAGIASGSFLTAGMVICPCSMGTLSAIATGASSNLIHRAADVHLKERRPLLLVPRETPLSLIQLTNMTTVTQAGATVLPAMPGFYHRPGGLGDVIDFIVARILDHIRIPHPLGRRWGAEQKAFDAVE